MAYVLLAGAVIVLVVSCTRPPEIPVDPVATVDCDALRKRRLELAPNLQSCTSDEQCFLYPCSCSSIARGPVADEYMLIARRLADGCGDELVFAYCGHTEPVCVEGQCQVRHPFERGR